MTLNILFFTVTIKKRTITIKEALHNQMVEEIYEENRARYISTMRPF